MTIDSKQWKLTVDRYAAVVTHKPSRQCRSVDRDGLPSYMALAMMHERTFDQFMRNAFNAAR